MKLHVTLLFAAITLATAVPALAQVQARSRPERPYRGLFGGDTGDAEQLLTLNFFAGVGYDDNLLLEQPTQGSNDPRQGDGGGFNSFNGQLSYSLDRTRVDFSAAFATAARYYPDLERSFIGSHALSLGAGLQLAKQTRFAASHTSRYQPFLTFGYFALVPDLSAEGIPPQQDQSIARSGYFTHLSGVDLTQEVSQRGSLSFNYRHQLSDAEADDRDFRTQTVGGRFVHGLAKGLGVRVGYGFNASSYQSATRDAIAAHNIDVGIDYNRALSFSRRTTLSFGTGTSAFVDRNDTLYRLTGNASLTREIGRTWSASLAYLRTAGFLESVAAPVFADDVRLTWIGMLNRRLQFDARAWASVGEFARAGEGSGYDSYASQVTLTYGLTRYLGINGIYGFYRYSFDESPLLPGFAREMSRHSVQVQLGLWLPLIQSGRRPDASR